MNNFFCISFYEGDLSWVDEIARGRHVIYSKGKVSDSYAGLNIIDMPNVGYNIYSYLTYIIDHYESLPEIVVFCKNNVFPRHVSKNIFEDCASRKVFTPIEDPSRWGKIKFPVWLISSDGGYLELNNSWYARQFPRKYFSDYNKFYEFIFNTKVLPTYLRFAPGANYTVPRENILLRSKNFYINLKTFVGHSQFSGESHYVERSLMSIWNSTLKESDAMARILQPDELSGELEKICASARDGLVKRFKNIIFKKISEMAFNLSAIEEVCDSHDLHK